MEGRSDAATAGTTRSRGDRCQQGLAQLALSSGGRDCARRRRHGLRRLGLRATGFRKLVAVKTLRSDLAAEPALVRMLSRRRRSPRACITRTSRSCTTWAMTADLLVMEYVAWRVASAVLARGRAAPHRVWIAAHVCDALAYAHALRDERGALLAWFTAMCRRKHPGRLRGRASPARLRIARVHHRTSRHRARRHQGAVRVHGRRSNEPEADRRPCRSAPLGIVPVPGDRGIHPWELAGTATNRIPDPRPHRPGFRHARH